MTTATVTYHKLPQIPGWTPSNRNHINSQLTTTAVPNGYVTKEFAEEEVRWSKYHSQERFQEHFIESSTQQPKKKTRGSKCRAPTLAMAGEELCLVCGDKASGYHYNALTCEGCKGFFRRSITRRVVYYCKFGQTCDIDMYMRRKCQHCRLEKCRKIGMRAELVIPEEQCRIKREAKMRQRSNLHEGAELPSPSSVELPQQIQCDPSTVENIGMSSESRELVARMIASSDLISLARDEALATLARHPVYCSTAFQQLAELIILEMQYAHKFVHQLPGFSRLGKADRITLQKVSKTEIIVLRTASRYDASKGCLILGNDRYSFCYDRQMYCDAGMTPFVDFVFELAQKMADLSPNATEMLLLQAIIAFSERPGLLDAKAVEETQEIYMDTLKQLVDTRRPKNSTLYRSLIDVLSDLRLFCRAHVDCTPSTLTRLNHLTGAKSEKSLLEQMMQPEASSYPVHLVNH